MSALFVIASDCLIGCSTTLRKENVEMTATQIIFKHEDFEKGMGLPTGFLRGYCLRCQLARHPIPAHADLR